VIASVRGSVTSLAPDGAVVEIGGVGLQVQCTPGTLAGLRVGDTAALATSLVVREDSLTLYGFATDDERAVFELLQTASGVGPRLAQAMLAVHPPESLRRIVATEDLAALCQVPGIGRKGAQRIVLELRDRLGPAGTSGSISVTRGSLTVTSGWQPQVHSALLGLGWSTREADEAVLAVAPTAAENPGDPDVSTLLRAALQTLSRG
jgi:holliday junction DNA helicase RuvA